MVRGPWQAGRAQVRIRRSLELCHLIVIIALDCLRPVYPLGLFIPNAVKCRSFSGLKQAFPAPSPEEESPPVPEGLLRQAMATLAVWCDCTGMCRGERGRSRCPGNTSAPPSLGLSSPAEDRECNPNPEGGQHS